MDPFVPQLLAAAQTVPGTDAARVMLDAAEELALIRTTLERASFGTFDPTKYTSANLHALLVASWS